MKVTLRSHGLSRETVVNKPNSMPHINFDFGHTIITETIEMVFDGLSAFRNRISIISSNFKQFQ